MQLERVNRAPWLKAGHGARLSAFKSCYTIYFLPKLRTQLDGSLTFPGFGFLICRLMCLR